MELEEIPFDLLALSEDVSNLLAVKARDKALELILHYVPNTPQYLIGDPGRIRQVICNLVGNALKFTEKGHVILKIEEEASEENKIYIKFSIIDTGIGITEAARKRIFEKFSQADTSTTREYGGTGLGLTISLLLSEMMGGEIGLESDEGKGSTFWFTIELKEDTRAHTSLPPPEILKGMKALIVDDIQVNREILQQHLTNNLSMNCIAIYDPDEAIETLRKANKDGAPFDIVLMDYLMPNTNGLTLTKTIKKDKKINDMPIVMLSLGSTEGNDKAYKEAGFAGFISKPFKIKNLTALLTYIISEQVNKKSNIFITQDDITDDDENATYKNIKFNAPNILVAEDSRINQTFITEVLEQVGCIVDVATNGKIAIEKLKNNKFDLVLMDYEMPEMGGLEATEGIMKLIEAKVINDINIIAISAHSFLDINKEYFNAGNERH